jgi:hypothetical protein
MLGFKSVFVAIPSDHARFDNSPSQHIYKLPSLPRAIYDHTTSKYGVKVSLLEPDRNFRGVDSMLDVFVKQLS